MGSTFLGGGFKHVLFSPLLGKDSHLANIFQMDENHQLVKVGSIFLSAIFQVVEIQSNFPTLEDLEAAHLEDTAQRDQEAPRGGG